jgi:hypothetical protein
VFVTFIWFLRYRLRSSSGTEELAPVKDSPCVYTRDTAGSSSCSPPVVRNLGTESSSGCISTLNTAGFKEVKTALALHDLPSGIVHDIHSCILQRPGFEKRLWPYILDNNLVFEPRKSALLLAMYSLGEF